jgi:hypothetical protein
MGWFKSVVHSIVKPIEAIGYAATGDFEEAGASLKEGGDALKETFYDPFVDVAKSEEGQQAALIVLAGATGGAGAAALTGGTLLYQKEQQKQQEKEAQKIIQQQEAAAMRVLMEQEAAANRLLEKDFTMQSANIQQDTGRITSYFNGIPLPEIGGTTNKDVLSTQKVSVPNYALIFGVVGAALIVIYFIGKKGK